MLTDEHTEELLLVCLFVSNLTMFVCCLSDEDTEELLLVCLFVSNLIMFVRCLSDEDTEEVMLAGRNLGVFVGILTMTATWVGGGYINGSAEETFKSGLVWTQAPFGYSISLALGQWGYATG